MPIVVEYALVLRNDGSFCDSDQALNRLLQVDSAVSLKPGKITYKNTLECNYAVTARDITEKNQRFFQCRFSIEGECERDIEALTELLKSVRRSMEKAGGRPQTLWDDVSRYYARQAYEHINRIENLMRKLIANFMLVTVGIDWFSEASPKEFKEAVAKSKRKEDTPVLESVDFIHLADFLLKPYSNKDPNELFLRLKKAESVDEFKDLRQYVPESNWTRYFSGLVDCNDGYLKSRWGELYDLRCIVAHNAAIRKCDLARIKELICELEPKIQDGINKLPQLKVAEADFEQIAASAARNAEGWLAPVSFTAADHLDAADALFLALRGTNDRNIRRLLGTIRNDLGTPHDRIRDPSPEPTPPTLTPPNPQTNEGSPD